LCPNFYMLEVPRKILTVFTSCRPDVNIDIIVLYILFFYIHCSSRPPQNDLLNTNYFLSLYFFINYGLTQSEKIKTQLIFSRGFSLFVKYILKAFSLCSNFNFNVFQYHSHCNHRCFVLHNFTLLMARQKIQTNTFLP
jgi:hypothetical protein